MREEPEIETHDTVTISELQNLPEDVVLRSWRAYSLALDSSAPTGMHYDKTSRLLTALGTSFKCAQMFSSDDKIFFGELTGNIEAQEVMKRQAAEFFLSAGGPQEGFRSLRAQTAKAVATFCKGQSEMCKEDAGLSRDPVPDSCQRPTIFCTKALACAVPQSSTKAPLLDGEWYLYCKERRYHVALPP